MRNKWLIVLIVFFCSFSGAGYHSRPPKEALLLTFDDRNMLHWKEKIPLFKKYNAHVTFFIDNFDKLNDEQIKALHALKEAGHTIGCHGLRHVNAVEFVKNNSLREYMNAEVIPAIKEMKSKGFDPVVFAYPVSSRNEETDSGLLNHFKLLRSGCRIKGEIEKTDAAFVKAKDFGDRKSVDGISFHPKLAGDSLVLQAKKALDRLKRNNEILTLYAHDIRSEIEKGPRHFITDEALEEILAYARKNGIGIYSFEEML